MPHEAGAVAPGMPEGALASGYFSDRVRRVGRWWVILTVPLVTVAGLFVEGETGYLAGWVLLSGLYTTPALVVSTMLCARLNRRDRSRDRVFWRYWRAGIISIYFVGLSLLGAAFTGSATLRALSTAFVTVTTVTFTIGMVALMRFRSGSRAVVVDVLESTMLILGLIALAVPPLFEPIRTSDNVWYAVSASVACVMLLCGFCWMLSMRRRVESGARVVEALGFVLLGLGVLDAVAQLAQALTDFALPAAPLYLLHGLCMGLLLLLPLHRMKDSPIGLDRLPPHAQVRGAGVEPALVPVMSGILIIESLVLRDRVPWALPGAGAVLVAQLVLMAARYHLAARETRRLYAHVQAAAEERRRLLADIMQSVDQDRHRVAAQLHEQATSSYVAFSSYVRGATGDGGDSPSARALSAVQRELGSQAESLRQLMLAIKPLETGEPGPTRLSAPIAAYLDNLYHDRPRPVLVIDVDRELELDWTTETLVFRILQEALRNVWAHADADHVCVAIRYERDALAVRVEDDGRGFDPGAVLFESGIAMMRSFAALAGGSIEIDSAPGRGTSVVAHLGGTIGPAPADAYPAELTATTNDPITGNERSADHSRPPGRAPHLRLVP